MKRLLGITLVMAFVVGCSLAPSTNLKAAAAEPQACMDALLGGKLTRHAETGLGVTSADGTSTAVEWPFGYTARNELGKLVLLDKTGKVVAREGDEITVGGGFGNTLWHACGGVNVAKAAS